VDTASPVVMHQTGRNLPCLLASLFAWLKFTLEQAILCVNRHTMIITALVLHKATLSSRCIAEYIVNNIICTVWPDVVIAADYRQHFEANLVH